MTGNRLDRTTRNDLKASPSDRIEIWDSPVEHEKLNLTVRDRDGCEVLRVYGLSRDQLAALARDVGMTLGLTTAPTVHELRRIYDDLGRLLSKYNPPPMATDWPDSQAFPAVGFDCFATEGIADLWAFDHPPTT